MIKAVIFDLDGVTIDSQPIWFEAYALAAQKFGYTYTKELIPITRGIGATRSVKNLVSQFGIPEKGPAFLEATKSFYNDLFDEKASLMPGVIELLKKLKGNYKLALASSSPRFNIEQNFAKFPVLKRFFRISVAGDEVAATKPNPAIFLLTAKKLGISPRNALVIEDSPAGVAAAKAAGMKCVGLLDPGPKKQDLSQADEQVEGLTDVTVRLISKF